MPLFKCWARTTRTDLGAVGQLRTAFVEPENPRNLWPNYCCGFGSRLEQR